MNIKEEYIKFFESKNHDFLEPVSLVPDDDSTLFTSAGIQQLVPYMVNEEIHPEGTRLTNYQKCLRLTDIDNIGDSYHHTFFEMLGNWSMDDYFKQEVIQMSYEFLISVLKLDPNRLAVSVFAGGEDLPRDDEAAQIWESLGIPKSRIAYLGYDDNWWPSVHEKGPCGSNTEMFYFRSEDSVPKDFDPSDDRWVEIWNNVFIQFYRDDNMNLVPLKRRYIDTGMGVERMTSILNHLNDNYESDLFKFSIEIIEKYSQKKYEDHKKNMRIIADHIRAISMICFDDQNIIPSNKDRGYVLRRLIRRLIIASNKLEVQDFGNYIDQLVNEVVLQFKDFYPGIEKEQDRVVVIILEEYNKFNKILKSGKKRIQKAIDVLKENSLSKMDASIIFRLYETYGIPFDLTYSMLSEQGISYDTSEVDSLFEQHRIHSKKSSTMFGSGLSKTKKITQ